MHRRLLGLLVIAMFVFTACQGSATPSPASQAPASTGPSASAASESPSGSAPASPAASAGACAPDDINCLVFATNYKPTQGTSGGTIVMGEWQPVDQLNMFYTTAFTSVEATVPAQRNFLTVSSDGKFIPDLAASVPQPQMDANGKGFTLDINLKPGLLWSDGQPLTMNDLKYTVTWAQDKAQSGCTGCAIGFPDIDNVTVKSDTEATVHFKDLTPTWLGWMTGLPTALLPEHYMKTIAIKDAPKQSMPVSSAIAKVPWSGPFMITNASPTEIDYDRNPNWKGGVSSAHPAYLDHLKFQYFGDKNGMIAAFKNGEIDLALDLTQADYATLQGIDPSVGTDELTAAWQYEHFDLNNDPTHARKNGLWDPKVRQAIYQAVDKAKIISTAFPGANLTPACSLTAPSLWYAKNEQCPSFDPNAAKQLLSDAGWKPGSDGFVADSSGHKMRLELCTTAGNPTRLTELQLMQGFLKDVGIDSYVKTADAGSVVFAGWNDTKPDTDCSIFRGNYDVADFAYILTGAPYNDYYFNYHSSQWPEKGDHSGANDTRISDPALDAALVKLGTDVQLSDQLKDAGAVQDAYVKAFPEIPLYYRAETTGVGAHLGNWAGYNPSSIGPTWNVEDWFSKS